MIPQWDATFSAQGASEFDGMHRILRDAWRSAHRVLVPGGLMAVNVGDALRSDSDGFRLWPNHARILEDAVGLGFRPLPYLLWKKPINRPNAFLGSGFLPPNAYVTLDCEFILLLRKGGPRWYPPKDPAPGGEPVYKGGAGPVVLPDLGRYPGGAPIRGGTTDRSVPSGAAPSADPNVLVPGRDRSRPVRRHRDHSLGGASPRPPGHRGRAGPGLGGSAPSSDGRYDLGDGAVGAVRWRSSSSTAFRRYWRAASLSRSRCNSR